MLVAVVEVDTAVKSSRIKLCLTVAVLMKVLEAKEVEAEEQTKVQLLVVNQLQFLRILLYQDKLILAEVEVEEQVYQEIILLVKEVVKRRWQRYSDC
jgi:hypothetical protein